MKRYLILVGMIFASMMARGAVEVYIDRIEPESFNPTEGEQCRVMMTLTDEVARLDIEIRDFKNNVIYTRLLTNLLRGAQSFTWDGRNSSNKVAEPGDYRIEVIARDAAGNRSQDFIYVNVTDKAKEAPKTGKPALPELVPPKLVPSGYFMTQARVEEGESAIWEHRAQLQLDYKTEDLKIYARGDLRYTEDSGWGNDNSEVGITWSTKIMDFQFSLRDQLGSFNTPLQLYSDYSRGRQSYGFSVASKFEGINFNIIHNRSEGSKSNSTAARVSADILTGFTLSANYVLSIDEEGEDSAAYSVDTSIKISESIDISGEAATSSAGEGESSDLTYRITGNYRLKNFSASVGYQDIAKDFIADSAYLPNGTTADNHGFDLQLSYRASEDILFFQRPSLSLQLYNQATAEDQDINEYRTNLRFNMFKGMSIGMDYQYSDTPDRDSDAGSLRISGQIWEGQNASTRFSFNNSGDNESVSFYADTSFRVFTEISLRFSYQWNSQDVLTDEEKAEEETDSEDAYENSQGHLIRADASWRQTHLLFQYRITEKEETEDNFYIRLDQSFKLIERFNFTLYGAVGDLVSAEQKKQYELGMEMRF
ncbi:MAG: hypothetical protein JW737_04260 [Acidobacteria bacterium]|nr:hypothetical protein [Acidobacteriota bacterium]